LASRGENCRLGAEVNDPRDKLHASLNYASPDADDDLGPTYRTACEHWFAQLTEGERWRLATGLAAYERRAEADAQQLASVLPPAPVSPL
jgi:hypothetical protein